MATEPKKPLEPWEACDKIVAYLGKLGEKEFSRISKEIKRLREVRRNKTIQTLDFGNEKNNASTSTDTSKG